MKAPWKKFSYSGFFFCINDESKVDVEIPQIMHYMLCYEKLISFAILKWRARLRKGLVSYFKSNGIIVLKKHVDANHNLIARNFEKEMNNNIKKLLFKGNLQIKELE
jgi:hypothetical protein